ncbi:hypothetical protein AAEX37_01979 [Oligella sp. MSHR50489EDL]|uniref:hypothetical protein n=1 Tax=Oligella sp. MSHR50489EDL TaxID=3139409 RepID=UPI003D816041
MRYNPDFIIIPFDILADDRLTLRQIRVLMSILSWRKKDTNVSAISREMIAERTGYQLSRVSTITTELEILGWLKKEGNGGRSKWIRYQICDVNISKKDGLNGTQNGNHLEEETVAEIVTVTETETVTDLDLNGTQNGNLNGTQNGNETVTKRGTRIDTDRYTNRNTNRNTNKDRTIYIDPPSAKKEDRIDEVSDVEKSFNKFWTSGIVKINKKTSFSRYKTRLKESGMKPNDFADMLARDVRARLKAEQLGFDKMHPTTYLNGSRWEDEIVSNSREKQRFNPYEYMRSQNQSNQSGHSENNDSVLDIKARVIQ